jgi:hypothetical protein
MSRRITWFHREHDERGADRHRPEPGQPIKVPVSHARGATRTPRPAGGQPSGPGPVATPGPAPATPPITVPQQATAPRAVPQPAVADPASPQPMMSLAAPTQQMLSQVTPPPAGPETQPPGPHGQSQAVPTRLPTGQNRLHKVRILTKPGGPAGSAGPNAVASEAARLDLGPTEAAGTSGAAGAADAGGTDPAPVTPPPVGPAPVMPQPVSPQPVASAPVLGEQPAAAPGQASAPEPSPRSGEVRAAALVPGFDPDPQPVAAPTFVEPPAPSRPAGWPPRPPAEQEWSEQVGPAAVTEATRYLCVGAQTDAVFARRVITELVTHRRRFAAPAHGYDAVTVLGHALAARKRRQVRRLVIGLSLVSLLPLSFLGWQALLVDGVIALWLCWAATVVERLMALQVLIAHLRRPGQAGPHPGFTGRTPRHPMLTAEIAGAIRAEQDPMASTVFYGGFSPFVGAGRPLRSWSFAVGVDRPAGPRHARDTEAARAGQPARTTREQSVALPIFTAADVAAYVRERLTTALAEELADRQDGIEVAMRWYRRASGQQRPSFTQRHGGGPLETPGLGTARQYVSVRIGAAPHELLLSMFVGFELTGRTLHTEFQAFTLGPIRGEYRQADLLPDQLTTSIVTAVAWESLPRLFAPVARAAYAAVTAPRALMRGGGLASRPLAAPDGPGAPDAADASDYGSRLSVRELAGAPEYEDLFQQAAVWRDTAVVERRVLGLVQDFLEANRVDTTEFKERENALLNADAARIGH